VRGDWQTWLVELVVVGGWVACGLGFGTSSIFFRAELGSKEKITTVKIK